MRGGYLLLEKQRECMKSLGVGEADGVEEKTSAKVVHVKEGGSCGEVGVVGEFCHPDWGREGRRRNG